MFGQQYTNYSTKDGLPSNHVYRITQDFEGFIWIITDKGISKFDGESFKNFTTKDGLPSNDVWNIRITPDNKIWYFTKAKKLGYIYKDKVYAFASDQGVTFYPNVILQSKNEIALQDTDYYHTVKDSVWVTKKYQQNKKEPLLFEKSLLHPQVDFFGIKQLEEPTFVVSKSGKEVLHVSNAFFKTTDVGGQINDSLFFLKNNEKFFLLNLNTNDFKIHAYQDFSFNKDFKYLRYHYVNDEIQFTGSDFVCYLNEDLNFKNKFTIPENLDSHFSFIDKTGNTWSATFNNGVYVLPKTKKNVRYLASGKKIQQLKLVDSTLYAGVFKEGFLKVEDTLKPFLSNNEFQYGIFNIPEIESVFFSSTKELTRLKNSDLEPITLPTIYSGERLLYKRFVYYNNFLYTNTYRGLYKLNTQDFSIKKEYSINGLSSLSVTGDRFFIGSPEGLSELRNDSIVKLKASSLFNTKVISLANYKEKQIVAGTDGYGAYVTDGEGVFFIENTAGLIVQNICVSENKDIWLATNKGVFKVVTFDGRFKVVQTFNEADGLLLNNVNDLAVKNDSLYIGSDIGISIMAIDEKRSNQLQRLYFKNITVNAQSIAIEDFSIPYAGDNYLSFSIGAIDFYDQSSLRYAYKLSPINKDWISTSSKEINFTDLKPQSYTLDVKVTNTQDESIYKTLYFEITPLWYQTAWFNVLIILGSIILFFTLLFWSKNVISKRILNQEKAKQKAIYHELHALRSQMNPHFVFNSLNAVQYYMNKNELELSEKYLVKFSRLIRMFFDFSREQFITIDQELKLLNGYLEIEKMRFGDDFAFNFIVDPQLRLDTKIPSMLLQPIVENAVNHGLFHQEGKGMVILEFNKINNKEDFSVTVTDNGVGFKRSKEIQAHSIKKHTSKASEIILDRIDLINNSSSWDITQLITDLTTEKSSGTVVSLIFKKKQ